MVTQDVEFGVESVEDQSQVTGEYLECYLFHHDAVLLALHGLVVLPACKTNRELCMDFNDHVDQNNVSKCQGSSIL